MTVSEVMMVRWPEDAADGMLLAEQGTAVIYLVSGDGDPPPARSCLEDWVRVPGDERDLRARIAALEARSAAHLAPPRVDDGGRFHYDGKVVVLPADTVDVARTLVDGYGDVVDDHDLADVADGEVRPLVSQLRALLRDLGLTVARVRRRGYRLHDG